MKVIDVPNVHTALPVALDFLYKNGIARESRNGPVLMASTPVATVYANPIERVIFWPERDANPFFHLYESLWMLAGRNDVEGPARYAARMRTFSDDTKTFHGAYGHRWRLAFGFDQLEPIARRLREDANDRRCVLQMWDATSDLDKVSKDLPCNVTVTFQRGLVGQLNMVVFCRSNDIVWGAYGANAVHFSVLLEYMANWIGCSVGTYTQISVNWHGYMDVIQPLRWAGLVPDRAGYVEDPYANGHVKPTPLPEDRYECDQTISRLLTIADYQVEVPLTNDFEVIAGMVFRAHRAYQAHPKPRRFGEALIHLPSSNTHDWIVAAREWILRRELKWTEAK